MNFYEIKFNRMLNEMIGRYAKSDDMNRLIPEDRRNNYANKDTLTDTYNLGEDLFARM